MTLSIETTSEQYANDPGSGLVVINTTPGPPAAGNVTWSGQTTVTFGPAAVLPEPPGAGAE